MKTGVQVAIRHFDDDERRGGGLLIAAALFDTAAGFSPLGAAPPRAFGV